MQNARQPYAKFLTLPPLAVVLVVSGCGTNQSSVPVATYAKEACAPGSMIDAGIVFLGTETYQCYSLSQEITVRFLHAVGPEAGGTP